jgi:hypothetical protein
MKKILFALPFFFILNCTSQTVEETEDVHSDSFVEQSIADEATTVLLKDKGNFVTDYYYSILTQKKIVRPLNIVITDSTITVNGKEDVWKYKIIEERENTSDAYSALVNGGHSVYDEPQDYEIYFSNDMVKVTRLSNDAVWYYISESSRIAFEAALESNGFIFHK